MNEIARIFILLGVALIVIGLVVLVIQKLPFAGRLPGDIFIKRDNFTFYFPLATSIVVSILISLILYLINKFR
jgi:Protein of unknown function (DUF2905)